MKTISMTDMALEGLTSAQKDRAKALGYMGAFADRETVQQAYDYAIGMAKDCGDMQGNIITGIHVLINTIAKERAMEVPAGADPEFVAAAKDALNLMEHKGLNDRRVFWNLSRAITKAEGEKG